MNHFDYLKPQANEKQRVRISQREIAPTAIKGRSLSDIIFKSERTTAIASISTGSQLVLETVLTQNDTYSILAIPFISMYIGSVAAANQLPGGSSIDESQWQVIGPRMNQEDWESALYPRHKEYATVYVRDISAGTVDLIFVIDWKYISTREGVG